MAEKREEENKNREALLLERKKIIFNLVLFSTAAVVVLIGVLTMAWFSKNVNTNGTSMNVGTRVRSFDIITLSSDSTANKNGLYYDPYHNVIRENENENIEVWLVDENSNMQNYSDTGVDDETFGIEPGSSGEIKFCIKPYENVRLKLTFQIIGYAEQTTTVEGQEVVTMTELSATEDAHACFLNGHIQLFRRHNDSSAYYNGLIPVDDTGERFFIREFDLNGDYDVDTDGDHVDDAYEVKVHWVWPVTLDTMVYNQNSTAELLCDKDETVDEGETNDYNKLVENICTYPQFYLNGYSPTTTYTEQILLGKNAQYNDADQEIGMNVSYVLLRLTAEKVSD